MLRPMFNSKKSFYAVHKNTFEHSDPKHARTELDSIWPTAWEAHQRAHDLTKTVLEAYADAELTVLTQRDPRWGTLFSERVKTPTGGVAEVHYFVSPPMEVNIETDDFWNSEPEPDPYARRPLFENKIFSLVGELTPSCVATIRNLVVRYGGQWKPVQSFRVAHHVIMGANPPDELRRLATANGNPKSPETFIKEVQEAVAAGEARIKPGHALTCFSGLNFTIIAPKSLIQVKRLESMIKTFGGTLIRSDHITQVDFVIWCAGEISNETKEEVGKECKRLKIRNPSIIDIRGLVHWIFKAAATCPANGSNPRCDIKIANWNCQGAFDGLSFCVLENLNDQVEKQCERIRNASGTIKDIQDMQASDIVVSAFGQKTVHQEMIDKIKPKIIRPGEVMSLAKDLWPYYEALQVLRAVMQRRGEAEETLDDLKTGNSQMEKSTWAGSEQRVELAVPNRDAEELSSDTPVASGGLGDDLSENPRSPLDPSAVEEDSHNSNDSSSAPGDQQMSVRVKQEVVADDSDANKKRSRADSGPARPSKAVRFKQEA